ncbi:hypothetical protein ABK040_008073 [Willaertia magna]
MLVINHHLTDELLKEFENIKNTQTNNWKIILTLQQEENQPQFEYPLHQNILIKTSELFKDLLSLNIEEDYNNNFKDLSLQITEIFINNFEEKEIFALHILPILEGKTNVIDIDRGKSFLITLQYCDYLQMTEFKDILEKELKEMYDKKYIYKNISKYFDEHANYLFKYLFDEHPTFVTDKNLLNFHYERIIYGFYKWNIYFNKLKMEETFKLLNFDVFNYILSLNELTVYNEDQVMESIECYISLQNNYENIFKLFLNLRINYLSNEMFTKLITNYKNIFTNEMIEYFKQQRCNNTLQQPRKYINDILFSGNFDGFIQIWNLKKGICISSFKAHHGIIHCLKLLNRKNIYNNEQYIVSGGEDGIIHLMKVDYNNFTITSLEKRLIEDNCQISSMDIKNNLMVTCTVNGQLDIWDMSPIDELNNFKPKFKIISNNKEEFDFVRSICIHDDNYFITGNKDGSISVFDMTSERKEVFRSRKHFSHVMCLKSIIVPKNYQNTNNDNDYNNKEEHKEEEYEEYLFTGSCDRKTNIWKIIRSDNTTIDLKCLKTINLHTGYIYSLDVLIKNTENWNDNLIVTGGTDYKVLLSNIGNTNLEGKFIDHYNFVYSVLFNGNWQIISGGDDGTIRLFNIETKECDYTIEVGKNIRCLAIPNC